MGIEARRREEACAGGHALAHLSREMSRGALGSGVLKCSQHMATLPSPGEGVSPELVYIQSACPHCCAPKHAVADLAASRQHPISAWTRPSRGGARLELI